MAIDFIKVGESIAQLASRDSSKFHVRYNRSGLRALSTEKLNLPTLMEDVFTGCKNPVLEINAKQTAKHNVVEMLTKDGEEIITSKPVLFSKDEDVLSMLPETVGRLKKVTLGKKEAEEIILNDENLKSVFIRPLLGAKNPNLEISSKTGKNFNITVLVLKDGDKTVAKGAYSESTDKLGHKIRKYHINSNNTLSTGYQSGTSSRKKSEQVLSKELIQKILLLPELTLSYREKTLIFHRFALAGKKAMTIRELGEHFGLTPTRVKYIIDKGLKKIREYNLTPEMVETYKKYAKIPKYLGPKSDIYDVKSEVGAYQEAQRKLLSENPETRAKGLKTVQELTELSNIRAAQKAYRTIHNIPEPKVEDEISHSPVLNIIVTD